MTPLATVLIPTWDAPQTLGPAIASARAQTLSDLEILVVSDGARPDTVDIARSHAAADPRVRVLELPKGEARGERNRHEGVLAARSPVIAYLADDDLILPRHVELLVEALAANDLVQSRNVHITSEGLLHVWAADLAAPEWQAFHLTDPPHNRTSITGTAHTVEAYRRLANGWVIPQPGMWADLTLWREFLRLPGIRAATLTDVTTVQFPANSTPKDPAAAAAYRAPWVALLELPDVHERMQELAAQAEHRQLLKAELRMRMLAAKAQQLEAERDEVVTRAAAERSAAQAAMAEVTEQNARLADEREALESSLSDAMRAADRHQRALASTHASLSWRATAPLRRVRRAMGRRRS